MAEENPENPPAEPTPSPARELTNNEIVTTYDHETKWWTARSGPTEGGKQATSERGPVEAVSALLTLIQFSGHAFDPNFVLS